MIKLGTLKKNKSGMLTNESGSKMDEWDDEYETEDEFEPVDGLDSDDDFEIRSKKKE